jgi:curved DNA-binding protein CbpA
VQAKLKDAQDKAKKAKRKDYYKILDVPKTATEADIKKAYKKAALKWHPDKNSQTEEDRVKAEKMFKDINEANAVLTDKDKKDKYD